MLSAATATVPRISAKRPRVCIVVCSARDSATPISRPSVSMRGTASTDMASATTSWITRPEGASM
jgi:hypothetical protein